VRARARLANKQGSGVRQGQSFDGGDLARETAGRGTWEPRSLDRVHCDVCGRRALSRYDTRRALPHGWARRCAETLLPVVRPAAQDAQGGLRDTVRAAGERDVEDLGVEDLLGGDP
jgi:hypothetical protein